MNFAGIYRILSKILNMKKILSSYFSFYDILIDVRLVRLLLFFMNTNGKKLFIYENNKKGVGELIKKIDHIGIAVKSLEETLPFYTNVLKLPLLGIEEVESEKLKVAFLKIGDAKLELLEPTSAESTIAKFLEKRGQGIHHVALGVDSIQDRIKEIKAKGIRMIQEEPKIGAGGALVAFMHPKSTESVLFELCEKKGEGEKHD